MKLTVKGRIAERFEDELTHDAITRERSGGYGSKAPADAHIDLSKMTRSEVETLVEVFGGSGVSGTKVIAADLRRYLRAADGDLEDLTSRTVRQAAWMMEHFVAGLPHHVVFDEDKYDGGSYVGYFVNDVKYIPEQRRDGHVVEREHVGIELIHVENDTRHQSAEKWYSEDILNKTPVEILRKDGYVPETAVLWARLGAETERFYDLAERVGLKFTARGIGIADLDDASRHERSRNSWSSSRVRLDNFGVITPVVIDVLHETDSARESRGENARVNLYRWHEFNLRFFSPSEDDLVRYLEADEDTMEAPDIQVPVHPLIPCFDLRRHQRVRVHVNNLTEYEYRPEVAKGLILPERDWGLVDLLVDQSSNTFTDVVEGKGQSMNVLAGGPPGTGKTLTAEVLAEFKQRPLYSVQCSQLGLTPDEVENNLMIVLQRANRWNAVLLLDEADVYIRRRGTDIRQNAIVGVFLRVLEYAQCILFMTTNVVDQVDDAIASRCIVAVHYHVPEPDAQRAIWANLAGLNDIEIVDGTIDAFVDAHPRVSGRDVKNLLKLASFVSQKSGLPVDIETLEFALAYKPTADVTEEVEGSARGNRRGARDAE